jgi:hypothetical protein
MGELRNSYQILVRKSKGREYFVDLGVNGDKIEMDLGEVECEDMDWIYLT